MSELEELLEVKRLANELNFAVASCYYDYVASKIKPTKITDGFYDGWLKITYLVVFDSKGKKHELSAAKNEEIKESLKVLAQSI